MERYEKDLQECLGKITLKKEWIQKIQRNNKADQASTCKKVQNLLSQHMLAEKRLMSLKQGEEKLKNSLLDAKAAYKTASLLVEDKVFDLQFEEDSKQREEERKQQEEIQEEIALLTQYLKVVPLWMNFVNSLSEEEQNSTYALSEDNGDGQDLNNSSGREGGANDSAEVIKECAGSRDNTESKNTNDIFVSHQLMYELIGMPTEFEEKMHEDEQESIDSAKAVEEDLEFRAQKEEMYIMLEHDNVTGNSKADIDQISLVHLSGMLDVGLTSA